MSVEAFLTTAPVVHPLWGYPKATRFAGGSLLILNSFSIGFMQLQICWKINVLTLNKLSGRLSNDSCCSNPRLIASLTIGCVSGCYG